MMYYSTEEIKEIYPFEFNQENIAWKNFETFVGSNSIHRNSRVKKSIQDWIWVLNMELEAYNGICNFDYVVSFKSEADKTFFLLRFS